MPNPSIIKLLKQLFLHVSSDRKRQFVLLSVLILVTSFAEIVSIGAVLPFLGALSSPERVFELKSFQPIIQSLNLTEPKQLLLPITIFFILAALWAGVMRILLLWVSTRLSFAIGAGLSANIYKRTLYQPYAVHCARNSSQVIDAISGKVNIVIYSIIVPVLTLISSGAILLVILILLLFVQPIIALALIIGFGIIYGVILYFTRKQLLTNSRCIAHETTQVIKSLQEGLGGIRDVIISGSQRVYCQAYLNADQPLRLAQGNSLFIGASPRYGIEALGMITIAVLAYLLADNGDELTSVIPILGALALGVQRLLPAFQQAYGSWTQIRSGQSSLLDVLELLDQPLPDREDLETLKPLTFNHHITLNRVGFSYGYKIPRVLSNISLTIPKGSRVGFIGVTGSGKSTLLDIIMGLLQPTEGTLQVDNQVITSSNQRSWRARISHVPQTIFLADSSVEENIAFGFPKSEVDHNRVRWAAEQAQIAESIESWPDQYRTFVGERGVRLSGGQRQRIGIARALYKQADVIIFDEATSALDKETESAVMQSIEKMSNDLTILIIAHRLSTLNGCSQIVEINSGSIKQIGSYQDFMKQ